MGTTIDGVDSNDRLLQRLAVTIEENNGITMKQNIILVQYTKWLFWLTLTIGVVAILQLVIVMKSA
jgi:hypothetical protein